MEHETIHETIKTHIIKLTEREANQLHNIIVDILDYNSISDDFLSVYKVDFLRMLKDGL